MNLQKRMKSICMASFPDLYVMRWLSRFLEHVFPRSRLNARTHSRVLLPSTPSSGLLYAIPPCTSLYPVPARPTWPFQSPHGSSRLSTLMTDVPGDLVLDLPCMQQASYLEGGPLMWMLPLYLHVNQKTNYDMMMIMGSEIPGILAVTAPSWSKNRSLTSSLDLSVGHSHTEYPHAGQL